MKKSAWMCSSILMAAVMALGYSSALTAEDKSDVDALRQLAKVWKSYYIAGNYSAIPDLYTADAIVMPRGRPLIDGREALRKAMGGLAAGRKVDIDVNEREIVVVDKYAWFLGDFTVVYSPKDSTAQPKTEYGRSMLIFKKGTDGQWRIHRDMDSPAPAPDTTASR